MACCCLTNVGCITYLMMTRIQKKTSWLSVGFILILLFTILNLKIGVIQSHWRDLFEILIGHEAKNILSITVIQIRFPEIILAMIAGAGLAVSGFLLQRVTQNPLACPSLSGVEYGTACGVVLTYLFFPHATRLAIIFISLVQGVFTYYLMQLIIKKINASSFGITLIGVAFNTFYYAIIQALLLRFPYEAQSILYDLNGSLQNIFWSDIQIIFLPFIVLLALAFGFEKRLELLDLDELQATALGVSVKKYQLGALIIAILLATLITSLTGPLLFFGLIIPHIINPIAPTGKKILFCSVFGSVLLLGAELMTKLIMPQTPPPVGLVLLLISAPILIYIIRRFYVYDEL